jgi:hypothetical protein
LRAIIGTSLVIVAQVATISLLYYLRVRRWDPASSDLLVFGLPSLLGVLGAAAICGYAGIAGGRGALRGVVVMFWGVASGAIGLELALVFALNRWGA